MEPFLIIIVPGLLGGVLFALLFARLHGTPSESEPDTRLAPPSPNLINMARIRVSGLGGLGMLAMSIVVAIFVPRIRVTMAIALVLGAAMAAVLIAQRRRQSPWNSQHPGAHSMLPNETPELSTPQVRDSVQPGGHQLASPARP
jgi:hypothetical protein